MSVPDPAMALLISSGIDLNPGSTDAERQQRNQPSVQELTGHCMTTRPAQCLLDGLRPLQHLHRGSTPLPRLKNER